MKPAGGQALKPSRVGRLRLVQPWGEAQIDMTCVRGGGEGRELGEVLGEERQGLPACTSVQRARSPLHLGIVIIAAAITSGGHLADR
jgi:hypothetical protein